MGYPHSRYGINANHKPTPFTRVCMCVCVCVCVCVTETEKERIRERERDGERERERNGDPSQTPLMVQKDALTSYARLFTLMVAAIARRRMCEGSRSVRGLDDTELGCGAHAEGTCQSLYEAKDMESRT